MKKIIFILAISAVLLLSGCDGMLEVFYPDFADDNVVTINISITTNDISAYSYNTNKPLYIELYKTGEYPAANTAVRSIEIYNEFDYTATLYVSEGTYDVYIWQDSDGSGGFGGSDFTLNDLPTITLTGTNDTATYSAVNWTNTEL